MCVQNLTKRALSVTELMDFCARIYTGYFFENNKMRQVKHFKDANGSIYASISINTDTSLLLSTWSGELQQAGHVSQVLKYCCEQISNYQLKYWLSDVTSINGPYQSLSAEVQKVLLIELENLPLEYFALVSERSANPVRSAVLHGVRQFGIEVRTFECFASAMEWLMQVPVDRLVLGEEGK